MDDLGTAFDDYFRSFREPEDLHIEGEVFSTCPKCGLPDRTWQFVNAEFGMQPCTVECGCRAREDARAVFLKARAAGIPTKFMSATTAFAPDGYSAYLFGDPRTGKTYTACALALRAIAEGRSAIFTTMKDIAKHEFSDRDGGAAYMDKLASVDVLVLDDLGKGITSEWAVGKVFDVLNDRYNDGRGALITSNYSLSQLARALAGKSDQVTADSIARRIADICRPVRMGQQRMEA